jgi:Ser/Thr protein kinase RdoA (MazF antagonist)
MPFAENSITCDVVQTSAQAYEAAKQFGRFTRLLSDFDAKQLKVTIPQFHDLELRYRQFGDALSNGDKERIREAKEIIVALQEQKKIVDEYKSVIHNPQFKLRVTHHDTKISNVLFDQNNRGLCVIDLDTVMPGYFISDVGDMMRTYLSPVSEEENDFDKILVRSEFYKAIVEGYSDEMKDELTKVEKNYFLFAGKFMIYMQALRFLTDYFNNDVYYGAKYEGHNLVRAKNQATLLQRLVETEVTA